MKVLIDIAEEEYLMIKTKIITGDDGYLDRAVADGIQIPDNATNGDVIKAMFPNIKIRWETVSRIGITYKNNQDYITEFDLSWWNAPYQRGGK